MTIAVAFPGQGSQSQGMLKSLLIHDSFTKDLVQTASQILGYDLVELIHENPNNHLNQTAYTQPALLTTSYALWRCWQAHGHPQPHYLIGHSLGEYTALVCANALKFEDALLVVKLRGELMQQTVPEGEGAMAAIIGLSDEVVITLCRESSHHNKQVAAANFNAPGQVVISGHQSAVEIVMEKAKMNGAKLVMPLAVSVPSHSPLMKPAADALSLALDAIPIKTPLIPVIHNVDVQIHQSPEAIKEALVKQLYSPVRWVETVNRLIELGVSHLIECGPGQVLSGLHKRINRSLVLQQINNYEHCQRGVEHV